MKHFSKTHKHITRQLIGWFLNSFFPIPLRCILRKKCDLKPTSYRKVSLFSVFMVFTGKATHQGWWRCLAVLRLRQV